METVKNMDALELKQAFSRIAAGTSVVTMLDENEVAMGFTATAVSSVSVEPPMLLVCVNHLSRTIPAFQAGRRFVVNLLTRQQEWLGMRFASREPDKFAGVSYQISATGGLYLSETLAAMECLPVQVYPAGDHYIIVGQIVETRIGEEAQPLVFFRSHFME